MTTPATLCHVLKWQFRLTMISQVSDEANMAV
jgi:hypothetical protein